MEGRWGRRINFKVTSKQNGSMSKSPHVQEAILVEYCRSCETHSWCTHHDESKYHDTFLRFAELMAVHFPALEVIGNLVPAHLIPFKIAENKYIDANTNKYVVYPMIGSFEVRFRGRTLFSKKQAHAWPHLPALMQKIAALVAPERPLAVEGLPERSPRKGGEKSPKKEDSSNSFAESEEKKPFHKEQPKGFTLTDHFKMYRPKNRPQEKDWLTEKHESETSYKQISQTPRGDSRERSEPSQSTEKRSQLLGESKLKEMLRTKGLQLREQGRREMIIKLDSIEEENAQYEEGAAATQRTQELPRKNDKMRQFQDEMSSLESKFLNFENRVQDIHNRGKEFEYREAVSGEKKQESRLDRGSPSKKQDSAAKPMDRVNKLEQYLASNQHEKNEKLHRIYGEWKLIKQFGTRNRKGNKKKGEELPESSEDDTSQAKSQSPSTANVLAFRPKVEKTVDRSHPRPHPQQKYSSIERYNQPIAPISPTNSKIKTQDHFYARDDDHATRLTKKGLNASSMDALRSLAQTHNQNQTQKPSELHLNSTKSNLQKISTRISNIQQQLKKHKEWKEASPDPQQRKLSRSRDHSEYSSHSSNKFIRNYGGMQRSSHQSVNKGGKVAGKYGGSGEKKGSQFRERAGESVIEEEFEPMESKLVSKHSKDGGGEREGKGQRKEFAMPRRISQKKDQAKAFREKIIPPRDSKLPKEQLKLRQSKDANPRFSKQSSQSNPFHPITKKPLDPKPWQRPLQIKQPSQSRLSELKPLQKKVSKQTLSKMRLSDSKETVIRPRKKESYKQEKETPRKGQLQAEPEIHSEEEGSDREQSYRNRSEDQLQASRLSNNHPQKSHLSRQDPHNKPLPPYGRIMKNKASSDRQNGQYEQQSQQPTQHNPYDQVESDTVGNYSQAVQEDVKTETKMRKTLGYFRTEALCFRGARTSESRNRSDRERGKEGVIGNHQSEGPREFEDRVGSEDEDGEQAEDEQYGGREEDYGEHEEYIAHPTSAGKQSSKADSHLDNGQKERERNDSAELKSRRMGSNDSGSLQRVSLEKDISKRDKTDNVEYETVEGWKLNTEEEYDDNQFEPEDPEAELQQEEGREEAEEGRGEPQEEDVGSRLRRNSLDTQLQGDQLRVATERPIEKISRQSGRIVKVGRGSSQTERASKQPPKLAHTQPLPTQQPVQQASPAEKMSELSSPPHENGAIMRENSAVIHENTEQSVPRLRPIDQHEPEGETKAQSTDCRFTLDSPASVQPNVECEAITGYMKTIQAAVCRQIMLQHGDIDAETVAEPQMEGERQIEKEGSDPSLKDIQEMGEDSKLTSQKGEGEVERNDGDAVMPVAELQLKSNVNPEPSFTKQEEKHVQNGPIEKQVVLANSPTLNQTTNRPTPRQNSSKLADNVYSQSIPTNNFKQIGVQKELTLEVSIQTDSPLTHDPLHLHLPHRPNNPSPTPHDLPTLRTTHPQPEPLELTRAKIIDKIYSQTKEEQTCKFTRFAQGDDSILIKETGNVGKLASIYPGGTLLGERSLEVEAVSSKLGQFVKILHILAEQSEWLLRRLFEDGRGVQKERGFGVWLCRESRWECFIVDDCVKIDAQGQPLSTRHAGGQFWANILEKVLAVAVGGYQQLSTAPSGKLFTLLTGCNALSLKVKEDPSKNGKLLQLVSECLRKNYPIHAEKGWLGQEGESRREPLYRLLAVRRGAGEEEALLELSQDGRESFWLRLSKFTAEFGRVEVLQLRMGHNFAHVELGTPLNGQLSVVELDFLEEGQGCVTLSYIGCEGPLKAYLYRQEKSRLLKLVGQAREHSKSHLFFECNFTQGRYFLFAQAQDSPARLAYLGQGRPSLKITEEIHSDGLKNAVAEYLPVQQRGKENESGGSWRRGPRLRDNFVESRMREEFVEYVMGRSRRQ